MAEQYHQGVKLAVATEIVKYMDVK